VLGSVTNRLTIQAKCRVVVDGDGELPTTGPVVVGVDEFGPNAVRYAMAEAAVRQTSVRAVAAYTVLHEAFRIDPEMTARMRADVEAEATDTITRALAEVQGTSSASARVDQVGVEGRPAESILGHAEDAQLIDVGAHGKGLVRRVLLGSTSRQVLNDAERPVAVVELPDS
jgi:nucleotide-binding universal stress UspA family protein